MEKKNLIQKTKHQLNKSQENESGTHSALINGKEFVVFPNVFSPKYFGDSEFFSQSIPVIKNGSFLEIGCGSGVVAIWAALRGAAHVVATDINPDAVSNTIKNAGLHGLQNKMDIILGSIFEPVQGRVFDQIFWNVPFMYTDTAELNILEQSTFDYHDVKKTRLIQEAKNYLTPNGKLYIGYSSNYGDLEKILSLLQENNYTANVIAQTQQVFVGGTISLELIEAVPN